MKIDLHVHSKYSKRPSQWVLKKINCPESFTEPLQIYETARRKGMTHVTITDHNTIDGALEIAHLPGTFIGEEVTTYFPENGCKIHILALAITEAQHHDIQKNRENIYELAVYLTRQKIFHVVAHPLYSINDRLTADHLEKLVLMFENFELNGARNARENLFLKQILSTLTEEKMQRLAEKHKMAPVHPNAWRKRLWGGSDDHGGLNIARTYTEVAGLEKFDLASSLSCVTPEIVGCPATPLSMAHTLYSIAYQYYCDKLNLSRYCEKDRLIGFLERNLRVPTGNSSEPWLDRIYLFWRRRKERKQTTPESETLLSLLRHESLRLILDDPELTSPADDADTSVQGEQKWFDFVNKISERVMLHFGNHLMNHLSGINLFDVFHTIGSAGGLYALLAPFFLSYAQFSKDRALSQTVLRRFNGLDAAPGVSSNDQSHSFHLVHFTDTLYEVNGVALTLRQHVRYARKNNKPYTIITCHNRRPHESGVVHFEPVGVYDLPEYPELQIYFPPFLKMLNYCYEAGFTQVHTATPGPVGLAALAIARILKLPVSGTYHTAIPQYARILTGDEAIEDVAWRYMVWYYNQLDVVYVPSKSTGDELAEKGIDARKIRIYPRGIDADKFHPAKGNGIYKTRYSLPDGVKFLYVGRVSLEKNLHYLAEAFRQLALKQPNASLIVVGDGPYLQPMKAALAGLPCCFTGYQSGETLAELFASADVFVFPSATDTFGNVVLEAQASGLPVIVTDRGGPRENMLPNQTGLVVKSGDIQSLLEALMNLTGNAERRSAMGHAARRYAEQRSFEAAFLSTWRMYKEDLCPRKAG